MKILLLNDNPVVRKLVALSAQKTKDDLSVIWSVDEVEGSAYDLLIVDDAHYSDDAMSALKEKIQYKTSLLMATRGNTTPAGFDKVINKPFLPTDLVDLFSQIAKDLAPSVQDVKKEIVLDDTLEEDVDEEGFDITNLDDGLNLEDFDIEEDIFEVKTKVLDHEEVQELQGLLDDTDNIDNEDELSLDDLMGEVTLGAPVEDEDLLGSLDDDILEALEEKTPEGTPENELDDVMDEFDFEEEFLAQSDESNKPTDEIADEEELLASLDDLMGLDDETENEVTSDVSVPLEVSSQEDILDSLDDMIEMDELEEAQNIEDGPESEPELEPEKNIMEDEADELNALLLEGLEGFDEEIQPEEVVDDALSDDEFGELEQQIQEAVEELGIEDFEQTLDDVELGEFEGLGDLDSISERDIKLAIGEEVEEAEPEIHIGRGSHSSLDAEALSEAMGESSIMESDDDLEDIDMQMPIKTKPIEEHHGTPAEGIDALQALLKALSNEEVSKTLKGLSINININFGNEK